MRSREKFSKTREILCLQDGDPAGFKKVFLDNVIDKYTFFMDIQLDRGQCSVIKYYYVKCFL